MRKLLFVFAAIASLAAVGAVAQRARPAASNTQTVKITHSGYKPTSVSITVGDSVAFSNQDTVAHTVVFKTTTGMQCSQALPLVIQPSKSASCTFSSDGKFAFSDATNKSQKFRGTVTVAKAATVSLAAAPKEVIYGSKVGLTGTLASQQAGQSVQVFAQQCGQSSPRKLATVTTTSGGAYSYQTPPLKQTVYTVKYKNSSSTPSLIKVHPSLRLRKVARHRYAVRVLAAQSFAGKLATFQRFRKASQRWVKVKRVTLKANSTGTAPTVITSAKFRSRIKARVRVRVTLGQLQVGSCYLAGHSNAIRR